ncbi:MAG TPA: GYD domain-containing protein [Stellaceae bacterium]|nr:GYD domain-containing protein [Stellaceae bacterium]
MAKFLVKGNYTAEGLKGLQKDKASGRRAAVATACEALGGKLDALYVSLGDHDVVAIVDLPNTQAVVSLSVAASSSGLVRTKTTALLTVEEADQALAKSVSYRAPGR